MLVLRLRPSARRATSSCSVEQMVAQAAGQHEATPSSITLTHAHTRTGASTSKPLRLALFNRGSFASMREMISSAAMSSQRGGGRARGARRTNTEALTALQQPTRTRTRGVCAGQSRPRLALSIQAEVCIFKCEIYSGGSAQVARNLHDEGGRMSFARSRSLTLPDAIATEGAEKTPGRT